MVKVATEIGGASGPFRSNVTGMRWTAAQEQTLEAATQLVAQRRRAFVLVAREELTTERRRGGSRLTRRLSHAPRQIKGEEALPEGQRWETDGA